MSVPLDVTGVTKSFGAHVVLDSIDVRVGPGEAVVLIGPNGVGKSTLLGCVCGTVVPDSGAITIGGHDLGRAPIKARAALRYLPQEVEVPTGVTGDELLRFYADVHEAATDVDRCAEATELPRSALERLATTYSVGMRRRLAFGCLMAGEGQLYVMDEPFAGVDQHGRTRMHDRCKRLLDRGAGLLLAAHDQDLAALDDLGARRLQLGSPSEEAVD